jgi:hypothetical protein
MDDLSKNRLFIKLDKDENKRLNLVKEMGKIDGLSST